MRELNVNGVQAPARDDLRRVANARGYPARR
jgi:hypothetical protein